MSNTQIASEYEALKSTSGFVQLANQCFIRMSGEDRKKQLHSFCTAEINNRETGEVFEAFVLNTKGKILGFVNVFDDAEDLLLTGHGAQAETLIKHLDMYVIREDVSFSDVSNELTGFFVCGLEAESKLQVLLGIEKNGLPMQSHFVFAAIDSTEIKIAQLELAGNGFLIVCDRAAADGLAKRLESAGVARCSMESLEIVRIQAQTPWFDRDADDSNLPQELERDEKAISFNKGCYLGQETVARIDAIGRVNQLLVGLAFEAGFEPQVGLELVEAEKAVGRVTSIAKLPNEESWVGLGYVRRSFKEPKTKIGKAIVVGKD